MALTNAELERWYAKFDNVSDEHGVIQRTGSLLEFQCRFSGRYGSLCQDTAKSSARVEWGMMWGLRVRRTPPNAFKPAEDVPEEEMSVSLLLMRPKDVHLLEGKDVECRVTLHHGWSDSRDIHSDICRVDLRQAHSSLIDCIEIIIAGHWDAFLCNPSEYCDGEGSLLITCLLQVTGAKEKAASLQAYVDTLALQENTAANVKEQVHKQAEADKELVERSRIEGNELFKREQYLDAVVKYSNALSTFNGRQVAALWLNRSTAYMRVKMFDEALEDALKARSIKPDWPKVYFRIGTACMQLKKFKLASDSVGMGLQLKPGDVELMCLRMKVHMETRKNGV